MKAHKFADIFPMMSEEEYRGLVEDIRANGQREPIWTKDGKVIDGRNRLRACEELGIVPLVREWQGTGSLVEFIVSLNLHRRSLTPGQRAAVGTSIEEALAVEAKERQRAANTKESLEARASQVVEVGSNGESSRKPQSRDEAARMVGVGSTSISSAKRVKAADPVLHERLLSGDLTLSQATREVARRERRQAFQEKAKVAQESGADWEVIDGDCVAFMKELAPGSMRLIFADPPYNIGVDYGNGPEADQLDAEEYLDWSESWMLHAANLLADDGSMFVLIPDEWADEYGCLLRRTGLHRRRWIKWYETFGVNQASNYNRTSRHLFYMVKNPRNFIFNADAVSRESDRQAKYGDKRADPGGKIWDDIWGINPPIPRLVGTAEERLPDFPTQLPLALLRPIVAAHSEPGDMVFDPFAGSATTGAAALESGRRFLGIEKNPGYAEMARIRLATIS